MLIGQNVKNYFINSQFDIWQRGTSFNLATTGYTADRWLFEVSPDGGTAASGSVSRASYPGADQARPYILRINNTSVGTSLGADSKWMLSQRIEDVRAFAGKTITVSMWLATTIPNKTINVIWSQYFGSGGSPNALGGTQITLTGGSTVTKYSVTFTLPSIAGKTLGAGNTLVVGFTTQQGSSHAAAYGVAPISWQSTGNIDVYNMQVNEGPPADFELAGGGDPGAELALCQRYYEILPAWYDTRNIVSTANSYPYNTQLQFKVEKRAAPVMSYTINATSFSALAFSAITTRGAVFGVATGATGFSASSYVYVDSFTADAEL